MKKAGMQADFVMGREQRREDIETPVSSLGAFVGLIAGVGNQSCQLSEGIKGNSGQGGRGHLVMELGAHRSGQ
jgi:hypothetical protein